MTSGAGLGAMIVLFAWPALTVVVLPFAAIAGGVVAAAFVFFLAWRKALNPSVLILLGIAVSAVGSAGIQVMIVKASLWSSSSFIWLTGSTYGRGWNQFYSLFIFLIVLVPIAYYLGRKFDLLAFGDEFNRFWLAGSGNSAMGYDYRRFACSGSRCQRRDNRISRAYGAACSTDDDRASHKTLHYFVGTAGGD